MIRFFESSLVKAMKVTGLAGLLSLLTITAADAALEDQIRERITPVGQICIFGNECAAGIPMPGAGSGGPKDPETVYQTYCIACHGTGANNSPMRGDLEAWAPRLEKGIEVLYENAINGFNDNAMPPRGLCMDCSDDDIHATVDYLLEPVQ